MKIYFFLFIHLFTFYFSQESKCSRFIDSLNTSYFEKTPVLSKKYKTILVKQKDSSSTAYYTGIVRQFSKENYLVGKSSAFSKRINECGYKLSDWQITELYTQKGSLIKRMSVFYNTIQSGEAYMFGKQKKAFRSQGMGDVMFKLKTEDFVKILEQNSITPKSTKMRTGTGGKLFIERHITPSGSFWEYQLMFTYAPFISILVSDGEKKVLAKSFTLTPKDGSEEKTFEYQKARDSILYPKKDGFNFSEDQLMEILRKNNITKEAINFKKYAGRTWLIQTNVDPTGIKKFKPVLLLIDDISGKILIDINTYSKDLYGEEQFNQDFNKILIERTKKM